MKRLSVLIIPIVSIVPLLNGDQSPSPPIEEVSGSGGVLPREVVVPLAVVRRFFPEATQEMSTGKNATAVGKPVATRSVIYTNSDKSKKVTISVDQYMTARDAAAAYEEAVQKSRSVPGFRSTDAPDLGPQSFIGTVTQGAETHIGLGALRGALILGLTLAGYESHADNTAKLVSLAREEEKGVGAIANQHAETSRKIEIRFCPESAVRSYPLDMQRDLKSVLLQNAAVINHDTAPFKLENVVIELLQSNRIIESRNFDREDMERIGEKSAKLQASGALQQVAFQFCGTDLIAPSIKLGGATLAHDQGLLITSQVFAFTGKRDAIRIRVRGKVNDRPVEVTGSIPINSDFAKNKYIFPLRGVWFVGNGASFHTPHRWAIPEEFGLDIVKLGENGSSHKGDGTKFEDYFAYGAEVLATADGKVVSTANDQQEDQGAMQRPGETEEAYFARLRKEQGERLSKGAIGLTGNYVLIDHGKNEYSLCAHLQPGSVRVHAGEQVKAGAVLGKLGSSGNSTEPHLHFHVCDKPDPLMCAGIPVNFSNISIESDGGPRPIQTGDFVTVK